MKTTFFKNPEKTVTGEETVVSIKNPFLVERKFIFVKIVTSKFSVTRKVHPVTEKPYDIEKKVLLNSKEKELSFPLKEVTVEELNAARKAKIPSFVLKENGKYYYTKIDSSLGFFHSNLLGPETGHLCALPCNRLSSASDENGGCKKVRDKSVGIERYPWIVTGYETFSTERDSFIVCCCSHFVECSNKSEDDDDDEFLVSDDL